MAPSPNPFLGKWRIVEMEQWNRDYIDLVVPAHITFERGGEGSFQFGVVEGWLDCRLEKVQDELRIGFSWLGHDETDPMCGRGWATLQASELFGRLYIHGSDDSWFRAQRASPTRSRKRAA